MSYKNTHFVGRGVGGGGVGEGGGRERENIVPKEISDMEIFAVTLKERISFKSSPYFSKITNTREATFYPYKSCCKTA